jgi:hypothetical protein
MKAFVLLGLTAVFSWGCHPCEFNQVAKTGEAKKVALCIVLGEGGGIAGSWEGHTITGDGQVYVWRGGAARANERLLGRLPADTICALWDAARTLGGKPPDDSTGSLIQLLAVTMEGATTKYTWRPRIGTEVPPEGFRQFYDRCLAALRNSMTPNK